MEVGTNLKAKLPPPTMPDGLDAARQKAAIKALIGTDYDFDEFTRRVGDGEVGLDATVGDADVITAQRIRGCPQHQRTQQERPSSRHGDGRALRAARERCST